MIWPHRVRVTYEVPFNPPQYDDHGNQIFDEVDVTIPGQVVPMGSDAKLMGPTGVTFTKYQIILAPRVELPLFGVAVGIEWNGKQLTRDGAIERHMLKGRLHHYEMRTNTLV